MLVRLLYASRASDTIDDALVESIVRTSEARNREHGITGILCTIRTAASSCRPWRARGTR